MAGKSRPCKTGRITAGPYRDCGDRDRACDGDDLDSGAIPKIGGNDMTDRRKNMMSELKQIESEAYWLEGYVEVKCRDRIPLAYVKGIRALARSLMKAIE